MIFTCTKELLLNTEDSWVSLLLMLFLVLPKQILYTFENYVELYLGQIL